MGAIRIDLLSRLFNDVNSSKSRCHFRGDCTAKYFSFDQAITHNLIGQLQSDIMLPLKIGLFARQLLALQGLKAWLFRRKPTKMIEYGRSKTRKVLLHLEYIRKRNNAYQY